MNAKLTRMTSLALTSVPEVLTVITVKESSVGEAVTTEFNGGSPLSEVGERMERPSLPLERDHEMDEEDWKKRKVCWLERLFPK
jgi:hypothetical protein